MSELLYEKESYIIRGVVFDIYKEFRNSHKEKVYHTALYSELIQKGLGVEKEKRIDIFYKGTKVGTYTPDLLVENKIIIELKAKPQIDKYDVQQFWNYLKSTPYELGFLINFGKPNGVQIIRRIHIKK